MLILGDEGVVRVALLSISPEMLVEILKTLIPGSKKLEYHAHGLPQDIECVGVAYDPADGILLKLKSEKFDGVFENCRIPRLLSPVVKWVDDQVSDPDVRST
jgi:hypothetical protein